VDDEERRKLTRFVAHEFSAISDQYMQICSLIQAEAQSYMVMPLIPKTTSAHLVDDANEDVQEIVVQGPVIKATKDWLA
jgi:hypothetical protein